MTTWDQHGADWPTVAIVLREAAHRLREHGWTQGAFRDAETGSTDAVQAIASVLDVDLRTAGVRETRLVTTDIVTIAAAVSHAAVHVGCRFLSQWNDMPDRTIDEVVEALQAAAQSAEKQGAQS